MLHHDLPALVASSSRQMLMHVRAGHSLLGVFYELLLRERPAPAYADYMQRTSSIGLAVTTLYQARLLWLSLSALQKFHDKHIISIG